VRSVARLTDGEVIAIDGKTPRRSHNRPLGKGAIELVSAWAQSNRLTLGQLKVADGSNEITAVPELLRLVQIKGCIVTVDAINTQKGMVDEIREQEADYVVALKGNHGKLHEAVAELCEAVEEDRTVNLPFDVHETVEKDHGWIETRRYQSIAAVLNKFNIYDAIALSCLVPAAVRDSRRCHANPRREGMGKLIH
jgi:predicted transposase YbfD/YdcC